MRFEANLIVSDDEVDENCIKYMQGKVLMTLTKPKDKSKIDYSINPHPHVSTRIGSPEKIQMYGRCTQILHMKSIL